MSKEEIIYTKLDEMVKSLKERERMLAERVETGQLKNYERHNDFNQFYIKTLSSVARNMSTNTTEEAGKE